MNKLGARSLMVAGLFGLAGVFSNAGCGGGGGGGSAGHGGSGGHAGTGGAAGHAGSGGSTAGTGGSAAGTGGGSAGTGGSAAGTGGSTAGTGGSAAGSGGTGGTHTDGGLDGSHDASDGGAGTAAFLFTFDTDIQGWYLNSYGTGNLGATVDGSSAASLSWDTAVGSPTTTPTGSLKVTGDFTDYGQDILASVDIHPWVDASGGRTAHAWVLLDADDAGAGTTFTASLQSNSDGFKFAGGPAATLTAGTWTEINLPLTAVSGGFDPSKVIQLTVQISDATKTDGSAAFAGPINATFHIDTVSDGSGGAPPPALSHTFDKDTLGYTASANPAPTVDGGTGVVANVTWDSAVGNPAPGSLMLTATFNDYGQIADVNTAISPPVNLTGKTVHVKVRLDSGAFNGFAQIHASSTGYKFGSGGASGLSVSTTWTDLTLDPVMAHTGNAMFDETQVIQLGVQFGTGSRPDGGVFAGPVTAVFHIDSFVEQ
jgi:hypothetical protein